MRRASTNSSLQSTNNNNNNIHTPSSSQLPPPPPPTSFRAMPSSSFFSGQHQRVMLILAAVYPATLIMGSLFSNLSPDAQKGTYFARKNNLVNLVFVKNGWIWTTAAFMWHVVRYRGANIHSSGSNNNNNNNDGTSDKEKEKRVADNNNTIQGGGELAKSGLRWVLATASWILVTQWCFGPPLMDRTFTLTGGLCEPRYDGLRVNNAEHVNILTSTACKVAGGTWKGGHDLSGHVFMLTHASLFLWAEILPAILDSSHLGYVAERGEWIGVHWFVWGILGIWWWMLMMTSIYFHTWPEKLTGWIVSLIEVGLVYIWAIPNVVGVRSMIGVPGQ